jgi:hypothetical protein
LLQGPTVASAPQETRNGFSALRSGTGRAGGQQQQQQEGFGARQNPTVAAVVPNPSNYMSAFAPLQSPLMRMGHVGLGPYGSGDAGAGGMGVSHDLLQLLSAVPEVAVPPAAAGQLVQTSQPLSPESHPSSIKAAASGALQGMVASPITSPLTSPLCAADGGKGRWAWGSWWDSALSLAAPTSPAHAAAAADAAPASRGGQSRSQLHSSCSDTQAARSAGTGSSMSVRGAASSTHKVLRPHNSSPLPGEHPISPSAQPWSPGAASCGSTNGSISVSIPGDSVVCSPLAGSVAGAGMGLSELAAEAVRQRLASGDVVVEIEPPTKLATNLSWSTSPTAEYVLDAGSSGALPVAFAGSMGSLCSSSNGLPDGRTLGSGPSLRLSIPEEEGDPWHSQLQPSELGSGGFGLELLGALRQGSCDGSLLHGSVRLGSSTFSQSTVGRSAPTSPDRVSEGGRRRYRSSSSGGDHQWGRPAPVAAAGNGSTSSSVRERRQGGGPSPWSPAAVEGERPRAARALNAASAPLAVPARRRESVQELGSAVAAAPDGHANSAVGTIGVAAAAAVSPATGDLEYYRLMYQQCGVMPGGWEVAGATAREDQGHPEARGLGDMRLDPKTYYEDVAPSSWRPDGGDNCSALYT